MLENIREGLDTALNNAAMCSALLLASLGGRVAMPEPGISSPQTKGRCTAQALHADETWSCAGPVEAQVSDLGQRYDHECDDHDDGE